MANQFDSAWILPLVAVLILLVALLVYRRVRASRKGLDRILNDIAFARQDAIVLPNGMTGSSRSITSC